MICCPVSVHLPLAFEISTWVCVCLRRWDSLGVGSEDSPTCDLVLVENNSQWRRALPDGEYCKGWFVDNLGSFGALMQAVT